MKKLISLCLLLTLTAAAHAKELLVDNFLENGPVAGPKTLSPVWNAELGELLGRHGTAWSHSPALRLFTKRSDFKDVTVSFDLLTRGLDGDTPASGEPWDGVHLRLRQVSEESHYDLGLNRRDNTVVVKKKAQGTYYTLGAAVPYAVPFNSWQSVRASIIDEKEGSVTISIFIDDVLVATVVDNGSTGGPAIRSAGCVGLRSESAEIDVAHFVVADCERQLPRIVSSSMTVHGAQATFYWNTDIPSDSEVDYGPTNAYGQVATGGWLRDHMVAVAGLAADTVYHYRLRSKTGPSAVAETRDASFRTAATVDVSSPTVTFRSPAAGQGIPHGVVYTAVNAADDTGVAGVRFYLDGQPLGAEITVAPYSQTFPTSPFADGSHTLRAAARDAAGNVGIVEMTVTIGASLSAPGGAAGAAPPVGNTSTVTGAAGTPPSGDGPPATTGSGQAGAPGSPASPGSSTAPPDGGSVAIWSTPAPTGTPAPVSPDGAKAPERFLTPATADGINDAAHFGPQASHVSIFDVRGRKIFEAARQGAAAIVWGGRDMAGRLVETGVYIVKIIKDGGAKTYQSLAVAK